MTKKSTKYSNGKEDSSFAIYDNFAIFYDQLKGGPFGNWSLIQNILCLFGYRSDKGPLLELGCGTGDLLIWLIQHGFEVVGVDLSEGMLNRAHKKAVEKGLSLNCLNQDIRDFSLNQEFACIYSRETLVHIIEPTDLGKVFKNCFNHLQSKGLLIFEIATANELRRLCQGTTIKYPDYICRIDGEFDHIENKALLKYSFDLKNYQVKFEFSLKAYTPGELFSTLSAIGFKNIKFFDHNPRVRRKDGVPVDLLLEPVSFSTTSLLCCCSKQ